MFRGRKPQVVVGIYVGVQVVAIVQWLFDGSPTATAASFIWRVVAGALAATLVLLLAFAWYWARCRKDLALGR